MVIRVKRVEFNKNVNKIIERQELDRQGQAGGSNKQETEPNSAVRTCCRIVHLFNRFILIYLGRFFRLHLVAPSVRPPKETRWTFREKMRRHLIESFRWRDNEGRLVLLGWPNLVLLTYLYCTTHLLIVLCYQWSYDVHKIKLKHFRYLLNDTSRRRVLIESLPVSIEEYEANLVTELGQLRTTAKSVGAPYLEWSIVIECIHSYIIEATLVCFLLAPFLYNYHELIHFPLVKHYLDKDGAIKQRAEAVRFELNHFIESSRSFTNSHLKLVSGMGSIGGEQGTQQAGRPHGVVGGGENILDLSQIKMADISLLNKDTLIGQHDRMIEQLKVIVLSGRLKRMNRGQVWLDRCALCSVVMFTFMFTYGPASVVILYLVLVDLFDVPIEFKSYLDISFAFSWAWLLLVILNAAAYFGTMNMLNMLDQMKAFEELKALIYTLIRQNETYSFQLLAKFNKWAPPAAMKASERLEFDRHRIGRRKSTLLDPYLLNKSHRLPRIGADSFSSASGKFKTTPKDSFGPQFLDSSSSSLALKVSNNYGSSSSSSSSGNNKEDKTISSLVYMIDLNLLTILVHYRLLYEEFKQTKKTFDIFAVGYIMTTLSLPIIMRLLMAYMDPRLKSFAFGISIVSCSPTLFCMTPLCYLHTRCLETYKALSSLLAQLIEFETQPPLDVCLNLQHIISILRKELAYSDDFSKKFAVRAASGSVTYGRLLKVSFWASLIMFSLFDHRDDKHPRSDMIISRLFNDPFGLIDL